MKSDQERAHFYATRAERRNKPDGWPSDKYGYCGTYWWGLYEGYQAGIRRGKQLERVQDRQK